ncbi:TolC family protein [Desulfobacter vibrioformis]|uniref:TolC family protein n=1 Tax=Desulfobacter vibrioformis TaxID=34031 RepID=UPI0014703061|nr:TolC family protein [Desulfobacter vibrioformis]
MATAFDKHDPPAKTRAIFALGLLALTISISLAGCTLTKRQAQITLPEDLPQTWATRVCVDDLPIASNLLGLIDLPELKALVHEAMNNNPDLRATALRLKAEGFLLGRPRSQMLPKVEAGISRGRNNQGNNDNTGRTEPQTYHKISANVSWEIDMWGRLANEYSAAKQEVTAKEKDFLQARDALAARTIQAWINQLADRRAKGIEEERLAVLQHIEAVLIQRYRDGLGSLDEYSTARSRTQIARADLSTRQANLDRSVRALEILLGRYPGGQLSSGKEWPTLPMPIVDMPAAALSLRPDIQAGLARVEAARNLARAADKARLPLLSLSGEIFRTGTRISDIGSATTYWGVLGSLFQPLFQGGRLRDEARAKHSEAMAAIEDLHAIVLRSLSEVENALTLEKELAVQIVALGSAVEESEKSSRYYVYRYRQGLDSIQSLLIAREQEMTVKMRLNQLKADRLGNRIDLALAVGAGIGDNP